MNNKQFIFASIVIAICVLVGISLLNKPEESPKQGPARISDDILIKFHSPTKGPASAKVTIVEFLDPECEACRAMHPIVKDLLKEYDGKIRLVIRYLPLHKNSMYVSTVLEEARNHGKFDQALDILFENQPTWGNHHDPRPDLIPSYLESLKISKEILNSEALLAEHGSKIETDLLDGKSIGVLMTPTFFVNGIMLDQIGYEPLKLAIEKALINGGSQ